MIKSLTQMLPDDIHPILRKLHLHKIYRWYLWHTTSKYEEELEFQRQWAEEFTKNKHYVEEYWDEFRYLKKIKNICGFTSSKYVLDVGCGISSVLHFIDGKKHGIDPLAQEYADIYEYPDELCIMSGVGESIPFSNKSFSVVFCSNVLDHTSNPDRVVEEIHRVLATDGKLVLTVELHSQSGFRNPAHPHSFTEKTITSLIKPKFKIIDRWRSPWIGLRRYINDNYDRSGVNNDEIIMVLEPR